MREMLVKMESLREGVVAMLNRVVADNSHHPTGQEELQSRVVHDGAVGRHCHAMIGSDDPRVGNVVGHGEADVGHQSSHLNLLPWCDRLHVHTCHLRALVGVTEYVHVAFTDVQQLGFRCCCPRRCSLTAWLRRPRTQLPSWLFESERVAFSRFS